MRSFSCNDEIVTHNYKIMCHFFYFVNTVRFYKKLFLIYNFGNMVVISNDVISQERPFDLWNLLDILWDECVVLKVHYIEHIGLCRGIY